MNSVAFVVYSGIFCGLAVYGYIQKQIEAAEQFIKSADAKTQFAPQFVPSSSTRAGDLLGSM